MADIQTVVSNEFNQLATKEDTTSRNTDVRNVVGQVIRTHDDYVDVEVVNSDNRTAYEIPNCFVSLNTFSVDVGDWVQVSVMPNGTAVAFPIRKDLDFYSLPPVFTARVVEIFHSGQGEASNFPRIASVVPISHRRARVITCNIATSAQKRNSDDDRFIKGDLVLVLADYGLPVQSERSYAVPYNYPIFTIINKFEQEFLFNDVRVARGFDFARAPQNIELEANPYKGLINDGSVLVSVHNFQIERGTLPAGTANITFTEETDAGDNPRIFSSADYDLGLNPLDDDAQVNFIIQKPSLDVQTFVQLVSVRDTVDIERLGEPTPVQGTGSAYEEAWQLNLPNQGNDDLYSFEITALNIDNNRRTLSIYTIQRS